MNFSIETVDLNSFTFDTPKYVNNKKVLIIPMILDKYLQQGKKTDLVHARYNQDYKFLTFAEGSQNMERLNIWLKEQVSKGNVKDILRRELKKDKTFEVKTNEIFKIKVTTNNSILIKKEDDELTPSSAFDMESNIEVAVLYNAAIYFNLEDNTCGCVFTAKKIVWQEMKLDNILNEFD